MRASSCTAIMESDVGETKVLKAMIEAFSSEFSLREIASAYCKARRDPNRAAEFLYDGQKLKNCSNAASAGITTQCEANGTSSSASFFTTQWEANGTSSSASFRDPNRAAEFLYDGQKLKNCSNAASAGITTQCEANGTSSSASFLCESVDDKPSCANYWNSKASKTKELSVSTGSVSGVIGKGHAVPNMPAWGTVSRPSFSEILGGSVATNWGEDKGMNVPALSVGNVSGSVSGVMSKGNVMPNTPAWGPVSRIRPSYSETLGESVATNWGADEGLKASELKNSALSVGSISGKCLICSRPACDPLGTTKPLKLEMKDFRFDELTDDDVEDQMHTGLGRIFVGGIPPETGKRTLKDHFKKFGKVVETVIMTDKDTGSKRGFGYVLFSDPSVADKVLLERHVILGRLVGVEKAAPKPRSGHDNPCNQKGFNKKSNGNNGQFRTKKIFVGGLPHNLTEIDLKAYFEKFGKTREVVIMHPSTEDRPRGFGFINFKSEEAVENVMQQRFHELDGKVVVVERAVEKKRRKRFNELYDHNGGSNMRMDGGRGESLAGGTNSLSESGYGESYSGNSPQLSSGYATAEGTPVVSPRSSL